MKKILILISVVLSAVFLFYLLLPNPDFPIPPSDSIQSDEPADLETPQRRGYFTNFTREQVMVWYKNQFDRSVVYNIQLPTYRLNYPPENAQTIIRDQTRSTFLEQITHPFRESIYVNGYEPASEENYSVINGRKFRQKIIIKYVPSVVPVRVAVFAGIIFFAWVLIVSWEQTLSDIRGKKIKV
ncbi:MAG: hypothetical protein UT58_C0010G0005 [Microgenomates group bacterium GW2011_GWC1_39_7b]|uniref:Uncharacterized protein n=3 Tax=Candidatus Woeseibacteriota TaxID=1752722 RepID=A0A0G0P108_9BACT|nr:MAG: hypothetical protein UT17_C0004G0132 [Candidatus Woesebacteria bacterium GW2011_GWB1_39_10]KKR26571.1 MAG: hypothetical protein UT58_C0010G0005 [Microgenomates group bacterium GW2011_GWC1_39_7b]KKR74393.1 MAG: hypothetical protein UU16_C0001G0044 [Candidatus Woesebacteria bacterium GW2011_GWA2_40_7]KKS90775.1 MAG: hypothetical protein UV66_C0001G0132 [Candidatus Woesebacteria bacterium GW2011_GWA1_43_12]